MNGHDLNQNFPVVIAAVCLVCGLIAGFLVAVLVMWRRHDRIYAEGRAAGERYADAQARVHARVDALPRQRPDVTAVIHRSALFTRPKSHSRGPR